MKALAAAAILYFLAFSAHALRAEFPICGAAERITCVVDGDTVWFERVKYRFEEIDTPERGGLAECTDEALLATAATNRLAEILNTSEFTIETDGELDQYDRVIARFQIGDLSAGEMLVAEGLARPWRGRREDWCDG